MSFFMKLLFLTFTLMCFPISHAFSSEDKSTMLVKSQSNYDYQTTREYLLKSITNSGLILFGEFDHAKAAQDVGLKMLPTTVLVFGNPKGGTPLMIAHPELALDLPFRVLISQQHNGQVLVIYHNTEELQRYGIDQKLIQPLKNLELMVQKSIRKEPEQ